MKFPLIAGLFVLLTSACAQEPARFASHTEVTGHGTAWPLDAERIQQIVQQNPLLQGLNLSQAQIFLPPDFTTPVQNPELEIMRIQESPERNRFFVTLRCRKRTECASFLVEVTWPSARMRGLSDGNNALLSASFSASTSGRKKIARGPILVQPHTVAMLVIEEDGLRITEPVLPQKRARLGEIVRVNEPSAHRSIMAKVIGPGLLGPAAETNQPRVGRMQ
ncbi:MAG TPA: hypothetical protein VFA90_21070 [Terriglobales bacterium]|nr:hypothetical protein [Terriglobales bacterium]